MAANPAAMLDLPRAAFDAVVAHAVEGAPEEVCGLLGGDLGEDRSRVAVVERTANVAPAPDREYAIDPAEQLELMDRLEADGHEVVGFYHSHPRGPAGPSATDVARATWPGRSYVIVDLAGEAPFVGAWRWDGEGERFVREVLDVG